MDKNESWNNLITKVKTAKQTVISSSSNEEDNIMDSSENLNNVVGGLVPDGTMFGTLKR